MRFNGQLVEWNDARGFGFIQPENGGDRLFVHISALQPKPAAQKRPQVGMALTFAVGSEKGKKRATAVKWRPQDVQPATRQRGSGVPPKRSAISSQRAPGSAKNTASNQATGSYGTLLLFAVLWAVLALVWGIPGWVWAAYASLSLWCFATYAYDKRQAQSGGWRTPESTLHTLALLGGWPGALLAQQWLRHKSSKASFRTVFWFTVGLNMAGLLWLLSPQGRSYLPVM